MICSQNPNAKLKLKYFDFNFLSYELFFKNNGSRIEKKQKKIKRIRYSFFTKQKQKNQILDNLFKDDARFLKKREKRTG